MAKTYQKRLKREVDMNLEVPSHTTETSNVVIDKGKMDKSIKVISVLKWYERIWNFFTNPFTYLFTGKMRY